MKTFREFITEASATDIDPNAPASGGGMSEADIDARTDLDDKTKKKLKDRARGRAQQTRARTVKAPGFFQRFKDFADYLKNRPKKPSGGPTPQGQPFNPTGRPGSPGNSQTGYATNRGSGRQPPGGQPPTGGSSLSVAPPAPKGPGLRARLGNTAGLALAGVGGVIDYQTRRQAGQSRARSAGGALASVAGAARGAQLGYQITPGPLPYKLGGAVAGGILGDTATSAAYDYAADKTRPARQAVSKATGFDKFQQKNQLIKQGSGLQKTQGTVDTRSARQVASQAKTYGATKGSALTGLGGPTKVDTKAGTLTTKGKTVKLASTQLVRDPKTGQQRVGDLAYKGGKAVYLARPSVASRDTSLTANIGRALNLGRYSKKAEQKAAQTEYRTALKNTQAYTKGLGISTKSATAQKLPGYGTAPAPKPKPKK